MQSATLNRSRLQRKCSCGGSCSACAPKSVFRRSQSEGTRSVAAHPGFDVDFTNVRSHSGHGGPEAPNDDAVDRTTAATEDAAAPTTCQPDRALTWKDFPGKPSGTSAATTRWHFTLVTSKGGPSVRAVLDRTSGVSERARHPDDRTKNGCKANVQACEAFFAKGTGTFHLTSGKTCDASIDADPSVVATSASECATVLGNECDRVAMLDSERLLQHEQYHWNIACLLASKGTQALQSGAIKTGAEALTAVDDKSSTVTRQYDNETAHGCNAASQEAWEQDVSKGLPKVTILAPKKTKSSTKAAPSKGHK